MNTLSASNMNHR